jgi:hypothetical protein
MKPDSDFQAKFPSRKLAGKTKPAKVAEEIKAKFNAIKTSNFKPDIKRKSQQTSGAFFKTKDFFFKIVKAVGFVFSVLKKTYLKIARFIDFCIYKQDTK